jgi:acyl dehydratase
MADERVALMPQAELDEAMLEVMRAKTGAQLRIDHSVNNDYASRIAVAKFAGGIGDINPLWTDPEYGKGSPFGASVAPPSFVIGCFSGIQFGWPGLGSFHSESQLSFERPIYWGDEVHAACVYDGFDGPSPSSFAGRTVTDHFTNAYTNQRGERIATIRWHVINFERGSAARRRTGDTRTKPALPHRWTAKELVEIEARVLAERPRGAEPRFWEDVKVGDQLDVMTKGPIGLTDEIAFVAGGGTPIPRLKAHAAALHDYQAHAAWSFRDPVTSALEPIYSVHYNLQAANAMSAEYQYDVGFQRQSWQIHHLTHWSGDEGWIKECKAQYRKFVYLSDVIELTGEVMEKSVDSDGEHVIAVRTVASNQRGETVMPGSAVIALPTRDGSESPAARRARRGERADG